VSLTRRELLKGSLVAAGVLAAGSASNAFAATAKADVTHGPRDRKEVALTFHATGPAKLISTILGQINDANAHITVMAIGSWLVAQPSWAKKILDLGHDIGNHTMTHKTMPHLNATAADYEIRACARELKKLIGNHGKWFRPSGTQKSNAIIRQAAYNNGYPYCLSYSLDSMDWSDPSEKTVVNSVLHNVQNGDIISLHFGHQVTAKALPKILAGLHDKGLKPVTVSELLRK
jgi:peptidoglycan/xylan/chitin deacetylase (PgdA/CDA1 family)